ncbi:YggS family pyridoxal phosphate-dependent enzyme [Brytella acorum]|uniref:Pyridoxal phosphate homeostasis protein n=1 Tax=Brytella acorum TaxID=2959299 RepID=A0AA35V0R3_9PROT|nr:YggS family pyridoxal phosphate-dependent enzyme [Brytella acorum]CAI9120580.1 YggS family pyridoxal phosphate-dependent enzyme [Brytella acorum]
MSDDEIATRIQTIHARIDAAVAIAGRDRANVDLLAVTKFHPASSVEAALLAGQRLFGENRVQEAETKFPPLRERWPDLRLHLIGGLQTNKALAACRVADVIETLDRPSLSDAIARAGDRLGILPDLFVQVNTGDEPQKAGIPREQASAFIAECREKFGAKVRGLMCIPPENEDPRPHFRWLAALAGEHGLATLSMGMSGDFEAAIAEGATLVRVGSAIFGPRPRTGTGDTDTVP